jgi:hypothetical protein
MLFGANGERIPGQGQPNWSPLQYLQNLSNFFNGNQNAITYLETNLPQALANPSQLQALISYFTAWQTFRVVNWTLRTLRFLLQSLPLLTPAILNLGVAYLPNLAGLSGLTGLAAITVAPPAPAAPVPVAAPPELPQPVLAMAAPVSTPGPAPAPLTSAAPASPVPAPPPAPPAPVTGVEGFAYLVGGPGPGFGSALGARMTAEESSPDSAAAPAAAAALASREQTRASRRLRTVIDRGYRYEYLPAGEESGIADAMTDQYLSSGHGAGTLGFAGTGSKAGVRAAGLTTLAGDGFGGGPGLPMLPETWGNGSGGVVVRISDH